MTTADHTPTPADNSDSNPATDAASARSSAPPKAAASGARRIRGTPPPPAAPPPPARRGADRAGERSPHGAAPRSAPPPARPEPTAGTAPRPRVRLDKRAFRVQAPAAPVDSPTAVRLSKRVMDEADCSRAEAEQFIEGGRVTVNGVVVQDPPARVEPEDKVEVKGKSAPERLSPATFLLHKPAGTTTQAMLALLTEGNHMPKDRSGLTLLKKHLNNLQCLTPLEPAASGLVVWSQHTGIARKLQEEAISTEHEALGQVRGAVSPEALKVLNASAVVDGRAMLPARVSINQSQPDFTRLRFALKGYHPGQIVQQCEQAGLELMALHRVRIGRLPLASLPEGQWRFLLGYERF